jgi:hypothetical protein
MVPGIPQTFSISVISFTDRKFKSQLPSVTPSTRMLVRLPLHIILSVEAALHSKIMLPIINAVAKPVSACFAMLTTVGPPQGLSLTI